MKLLLLLVLSINLNKVQISHYKTALLQGIYENMIINFDRQNTMNSFCTFVHHTYPTIIR